MKVLVTGASGFIGYKTAIEFHRKDYDVIGWNRSEFNNGFPIMKVDMSDEDEMVEQLDAFHPDIIIHCAGSADVGRSVADPVMDYQGNVTITHNLLFTLHKLGLEKTRFVFLSSAGVYGNPISLPITEDMQLNPLSPYAVHKVMCEDLCKYFVRNYGMDIHVDDVVQSLYLLATEKSEEILFNVANGEEVTIRQATEIFADHAGVERNSIEFNGIVREGDPLNWRADIRRIRSLGYQKTIDMRDGIKKYVEWCRKDEENN